MTVKRKVVILGSTGMLGSMVKRFLGQQAEYELICPTRRDLDASWPTVVKLYGILNGCDYVINCIGVIKPRIDETDPASIRNAICVNSLFPHQLAQAAEWAKCRVLQIATDCVYSGLGAGNYIESSPHDALDIYGKTKSLGEIRSPAVRYLRCSIIGPEGEGRPKDSLLEWFLGQPQGATVKGYTNHYWNGVTTLTFAKLCHGIMSQRLELQQVQHIIPLNAVNKASLLNQFAYFYKRTDIQISIGDAPMAVDRALATNDGGKNLEIWNAAGYEQPPMISTMLQELAAYQ